VSVVRFAVGASGVHGSSNKQQARQPVEEKTTNDGRHAVSVRSTKVAVDHEHCAGNGKDVGDESEENKAGDKRNFERGRR